MSLGDPPQTERLPQLDGLRGIAIIFVLLWHWQVLFLTDGRYFISVLALAWSGVDLFFVLSGYLIGGILLDHVDDKNSFSVFYARRFFRIVPLYGLVLAIGLACGVGGFGPLIYYVTFTQNIWIALNNVWNYFGVTWSLAVEEQFYLIFPFLLWLTPKKFLPALLVVLICLAPLFRIFALNISLIAPYALFPCKMDALLSGVLCAYVMRQEKLRRWTAHNINILYLGLALLLIWPIYATIKGWTWYNFEMQSIGYTILALVYTCFLMIVIVEKRGPLAWLTKLAPLRRIGLLSYCIYLIHVGVLQIVSTQMWSRFSSDSTRRWTIFASSLLLVYVIAEVSRYLFETRLINIGKRWKYSGAAKPVYHSTADEHPGLIRLQDKRNPLLYRSKAAERAESTLPAVN